jgi:Cytochrome P460
VAHEAGNLNDFRAILGNDVAVTAFREGELPFPDGTIITRLAWSYVASEENNKVFGRSQSFVAGPAMDVQFLVKDSKKYAATGGWGFAQFKDGKPADESMHKTCFPLPRACQSSRLCLHPLRTLIPRTKTLNAYQHSLTPNPSLTSIEPSGNRSAPFR